MRPIKIACAVLPAILLCACQATPRHSSAIARRPSPATFTNPLLPSGADPSVAYRDGFYYYMQTTGNNLTIWRTRDITDLETAEKRVVWTPPAAGPASHDVWAPELHFVSGKWYIYFAADAGTDQTHRLFILENNSPDPLADSWVMKGQLTDPSNQWAIDPSVFEDRGKLYLLWSGWESDGKRWQNIYIAQLTNPSTVKSRRVKLSTAEFDWEEIGDRPLANDPHPAHVNEGPEILEHRGKIFLIYSASGCWTDYYALGMLTASSGSDLLNPASWKKSPRPVFSPLPAAHAFGTGHNTFFRSPDGREDWILYHANPESKQGCGRMRSPRAQRFTWNKDGTPNFGMPVPLNTTLQKPSGTRR